MIRGNQADCTAQIEPTAVPPNATSSPAAPRNRPLRPPSYHEATSNGSSEMPNIGPGCSISTIAQLCANINSPSTSRRITDAQQTEAERGATSQSRPTAPSSSPVAQQVLSAVETNRIHVSRVDVPPLSVHVDPRNRRTQRPTVSRPNVTGRNRRDRPCQLQRYTRINDPSRSQTTSQTTAAVASTSRHSVPMPTPTTGSARTSATTTTARYQIEDGMYSYRTGTNGRRVWCDVPPCLIDEDGPPPYTPYPDYPRSERSSASSQNQNGQAPLMR